MILHQRPLRTIYDTLSVNHLSTDEIKGTEQLISKCLCKFNTYIPSTNNGLPHRCFIYIGGLVVGGPPSTISLDRTSFEFFFREYMTLLFIEEYGDSR